MDKETTGFEYLEHLPEAERAYSGRLDRWLLNTFVNTSAASRNNRPWFNQCIKSTIDKKFNGKTVVIGITGLAGSGKDSAIDYLVNHEGGNELIHTTNLALADPLKHIAKLFGFTQKQLSNRELKETPDEFWGISPRQFLQMVGTEMFRKVWRDDAWVKLAERRIKKLSQELHEVELRFGGKAEEAHYRMIFVTDIRFHNEAQMIKNLGGYVVRVERPDNPNHISEKHDSERFIEELPVDLTIVNDADSSEKWSWKFAKDLTMFFDSRAFYY